MRRTITTPITLLLTVVTCALATAQIQEISETDYAVLSGFLRTQPGKRGDIHLGIGGSLVAPLTNVFIKPLNEGERAGLRARWQGLAADTIESFQNCIAKPMAIGHRLDLPDEYEIAAPEDIKDIKALYAHHPKANGYVHFSCVGVGRTGTQALFFLERWVHRFPDEGAWILMERDASGNWVLKDMFVKWIV